MRLNSKQRSCASTLLISLSGPPLEAWFVLTGCNQYPLAYYKTGALCTGNRLGNLKSVFFFFFNEFCTGVLGLEVLQVDYQVDVVTPVQRTWVAP